MPNPEPVQAGRMWFQSVYTSGSVDQELVAPAVHGIDQRTGFCCAAFAVIAAKSCMATSLSSCTLLSVPRSQHRLASRAQSQRRPFSSACILRRRQRDSLLCQAAKGFAPDSKSGSKKSKRKLDQSWISVGSLSEFPNNRPTRAVVLKDKSVVMLYKVDGEVYCSDANSTAFQYPLTHAKIVSGESGPAVEVPLDGTIYDLQSGKVLEWCPKNNLVRKVLGSIKSAQQPKKLKVYPTQVDEEGNIFAKFYTAA